MMRSTRRRTVARFIIAGALSLFLISCGQDDAGLTAGVEGQRSPTTDVALDREGTTPASSADQWDAIDEAQDLFNSSVGNNYAMSFELISQVSVEAGPIQVEVVDGRVATAAYPDVMTEQILPEIPLLTVADFFERARAVLANGGDVEIEFDEFYGHPLTMTLDPIPNAIDDEMSIVVQSLDPVEAAPESNY